MPIHPLRDQIDSASRFRSTKHPELGLRAELTEGGARVLFHGGGRTTWSMRLWCRNGFSLGERKLRQRDYTSQFGSIPKA